jgi:hypothetical protein
MKRLIAAVALAAITGSAFAVESGKPYEQVDVDRTLPTIAQPEVTTSGPSPFASQHDVIAPAA